MLNAILGAIGVAIAFSTKGQLGFFVAGTCLLVYLIYCRKWKIIWSWKTLVGVLSFIIAIAPILYAYYVQFDMHPEKIVHGKSTVSGVRFILWDQSFNRLTASGFQETSSDYFFFFHTLMWAYLPWSLIAYVAIFNRLKEVYISKFVFHPRLEILTSIGVLAVLIVISFSKFKLPHYLNSLLPVLSVLVAGYIYDLYKKGKKKTTKILLIIQYAVLTLGSIFVLFLMLWAFPMPHVGIILCYLFLLVGLCYVITAVMDRTKRLVIISVYFMVFINFCLNTQFYPKLLLYQAGNNAAKIVNSERIERNDVFMLEGRPSWSLDFYTERITPTVSISEVQKNVKDGQWLFLYGEQLEKLVAEGIQWSNMYEINHYRITRLSLKFLNPNSRDSNLEKGYLLQVQKNKI